MLTHRQTIFQHLSSYLSTVESFLCWFIGAIGNKFGEGYKSCATWTKEILTAAQSAHGELSEGRLHNEETA